jgi:hypothetical protein
LTGSERQDVFAKSQYPPTKSMWKNAALVPQKACKTRKGCKKKKNGGGTSYEAQDLLSRAAIDVLRIGRPRLFNKKKFAGGVIMECHVCAAIKMYQICWNVEAWNWVMEHQLMAMKNIPVNLGNTIPGFATTNRGKIKWPMEIRVPMAYI